MKFKELKTGQRFYFAKDAEQKQFTVTEVSETAIFYSTGLSAQGVGIKVDNEEFINRDIVLVTESVKDYPIKRFTATQELANAAAPLAEYLKNNHTPHCRAIVTSESVEIVEGINNIPDLFTTLSEYFKPE